jgi:hypothetical protein
MCIFEPRVVEFDNKRQGPSAFSSLGVDEEIVANPTDKMVGDVPVRMYKFMSEYSRRSAQTQAMIISTSHLIPIMAAQAQAALSPAPPTENPYPVEGC